MTNNSLNSFCPDDSFGPTVKVQSCRDGFDFTLLFEESMFTILPATFLLCAVPLRFWSIYRRPDAVKGSLLRIFKLVTIVVLCLLKLALLVLWTLPLYAALRTRTTIAATTLDLAATVAMGVLSPFEHSKSMRPSVLLSVFLFFTIILDIARARTEWLLPGSSATPAVFVAALAVKTLLLVLEALSKVSQSHTEGPDMPEQRSGIYSLSFFAWLNPLIYQGNRGNLKVHNLYPIDEHISSQSVHERVQKRWDSSSKDRSYSLALAIAKALWAPIAATMVPRLALIAFSIAQPFLIEDAINFVEGGTKPNRHGYGLIGAFGITYLGIAISTAWYQYLTSRALTIIRAALISIIYKSSLDIAVGTVEASSPVSLMGADVERVMSTLQWVISTAPNIIQAAIAIWILEKRLGAICVAPVIVVLVLAYASSQVAKKIRPRQRQWMQAVQQRVAYTSDVLGSIKGMKMLGLTEKVTGKVQDLREQELQKSKRFRHVQIVNITLGNAANMLSPIVTFIGYGIIAKYSSSKAPSAATIFSSLSLLSVLVSPVNELVSAIPNLASALDCCNRIQQYSEGEKQVDFRSLDREPKVSGVETDEETNNEKSERNTSIIRLKQVNAGWSPEKIVLHDLSLQISAGTLTIIVGPIGCGKSTLLQILLGEGILHSGSVSLSTDEIAYCGQTPFLPNQSIRQIILGNLDYDQGWYVSCLRACALDVDIRQFPEGDESRVGSKGISLSGGQKQRMAVARAVYARKKIVLMDDCLSGLDSETERHCFHQLLSQDGLIRQTGSTIVLVTHAVKWLPYSNQILVLSSEGRLLQSGTYQALVSVPGYLQSLNFKDNGIANASFITEPDVSLSALYPPMSNEKKDKEEVAESRGRRDPHNLLYYINTMGKSAFGLFLLFTTIQCVFIALQPLWLSWWVNSNTTRPDADLGKWLSVYAVFGILALAFLGIAAGFYLISLVPSSASKLHYSILRATMRAPMTFISATDSGSLLNRFTQDMTLMDMQLPMSLLLTTEGLGKTVAGAILTCVSSGYMALCLPFVGVVLFYLQKFYLQTSRQMRLLDLEAKSPLYTHLTETLDGVQTIRAYKWKGYVLSQNFGLLDLAQRPFYLLLCLQNWLNLVLDVVVACLAIVLVALAVTLRHSMNSSLLGVAMVSIVTFSQTLSSFVNYWTGIETSLGAISRTRQFVAETPVELPDGAAVLAKEAPDTSIEFRDVSASYQVSGPEVVQKINLTIDAGQRVAICGRTGSGKSTIVALLLRLLDPKSGAVFVGHDDISSFSPDTVRGHINSLPQDPWFLPGGHDTVRSNLDPLGESTESQIQVALEKVGLTEQIRTMGGLDAEMRGSHLSAGQRQLFCLARAMLMRRNKILLLDEATSSVDVPTEKLMMSLLRTEFQGWTIIAIVHRLQSIQDFDRVVVLDQGRVVECESPTVLLADDDSAFAKLYRNGEWQSS
ncbi:ABC transporter FUM19 [Lachnellula arida]|uniref:ABC transporter FUM19 n=1 Tax=Lachnellula arida TaxID=1316785 RepID=A0A8T9BB91_9HELO|nr:ABC transporter FUM19 [Lachnellula arida]